LRNATGKGAARGYLIKRGHYSLAHYRKIWGGDRRGDRLPSRLSKKTGRRKREAQAGTSCRAFSKNSPFFGNDGNEKKKFTEKRRPQRRAN